MSTRRYHVFVVDDEEIVRRSLASLLDTYEYDVTLLDSVEQLLTSLHSRQPDCILLDVRLPNIDGLQALRLLASRPETPPVIMMTGHGDVSTAVTALKNGAFDFIEKPIDDEKLADAIAQAISAHEKKSDSATRYAMLSPRERSIASLVAKGYSSIAIAAELGISNRTVDHHRANILAKMRATSLPQLMAMLLELGLQHRQDANGAS
jgi:two-component system response regulator FixJ